MSGTPPIVVGITGASGAPYVVRLLQQLTAAHRPVSLIVSKYGMRLLDTEAESPLSTRSAAPLERMPGTRACRVSRTTIGVRRRRRGPP